jgi:ABC-type tungstate transport system substrate-binding protein
MIWALIRVRVMQWKIKLIKIVKNSINFGTISIAIKIIPTILINLTWFSLTKRDSRIKAFRSIIKKILKKFTIFSGFLLFFHIKKNSNFICNKLFRFFNTNKKKR